MTHSTPDLIPEKLPIEKVSDKIKRIPLANGNRGKCSKYYGAHIAWLISYGPYGNVVDKKEIWLLRSDTSIYAFGQLSKNFGNNSMGA